MVGITDINGKVLKHYAQDTVNRKRYVVIALENENDPETCSVIDIDDVDANIRAELVSLVNSSECQTVEEIWQVLDRKYFLDYPQATMLRILQAMRKILVVPSAQVAIQLPGDQTMTPKEVANAIKLYKSQKGIKYQTFNPSAEVSKDVLETKKVETKYEDVKELETKFESLETKVDALVASLSALTSALSQDKTSKKK